ncbi:MAG: GPP34 family phosphoprotein, partial [Chloroflexota bacterium]|nr:GPP34 family phosphoprotein [Chloroflexota bacterium]
MSVTTDRVATHELTLPQELVLMFLNEETGYFHQVPGWNLNCAIIGALLAELLIRYRIDADGESLKVLDRTETGNSVLDPILARIANEPEEQTVQYWVERLVFRAPAIIDLILERLVEQNVLDYHEGEFWTLARTSWQTEVYARSRGTTAVEFVKTRVNKTIFDNEIPSLRDVIIICLLDTCDVLRFIFQLEDESEERIKLICRMSLIGRSVAEAVANSFAGPLLQRSALAKQIPVVPLHKVLLNPHVRSGNIPAIFAVLRQEYGPVFQLRPPFSEPLIFMAGPRVNQWVQQNGRHYLRARDYFTDFEKVYGASGLIPAVDGADHFRLRKAMSPGNSRERLETQLDEVYRSVRTYMADWKVGESYPARSLSRRMINAQLSPFFI